jgi:CDP-4-dehydro-6-deoxyglucose reductase
MKYHITLKPSDTTLTVDEQQTVLQAALNAGHTLPYSCRNGTCGTCLGEVLQGRVAYPDDQRPPALSETQMQSGKALFCQARPLSDLTIKVREIDAVADLTIRTLPCRVMRLQRLASDVMQINLRLPNHEQLPFLAGQYIDFLLRDSRRRSFSLANPPHASQHLELHVRHIPGGVFSDFAFNELKEQAILRLQGPLGTFFVRHDSQRPIIMVGGGTGFAPLKAMLEDLFHQDIERPIHLYWGARARRDLYLHELPLRWAQQQPLFQYTPVLSAPTKNDHWDGRSGWVHEAVAADYPDLSGYEVYMSGPPPMIEAAKTAFQAQGLALEHLHYDAFTPASD